MKIYALHLVESHNSIHKNKCYIINIFPSLKNGFDILYVDPYDNKIHLEHNLNNFIIQDKKYT